MKIVIDIPKTDYEYLKSHNKDGLYNVILNGTPLPENHGRLIDADAITKDVETLQSSFVINIDNMTGKILGCECLAPTIIERSDANEDSN